MRRPRLTVVKGSNVRDPVYLAKLYERLTGRKPTAQELAAEISNRSEAWADAPRIDNALEHAYVAQLGEFLTDKAGHRPPIRYTRQTLEASREAREALGFSRARLRKTLKLALQQGAIGVTWSRLVPFTVHSEAKRGGRKSGAIGPVQKVLRELLQENARAHTHDAELRLKRVLLGHGLKRDSIKVALSEARKALGIKNS